MPCLCLLRIQRVWQRPIVQRVVLASIERRWQRKQQQHLERSEVRRQEQPQGSESAHRDRQQHAPRPAYHLAVNIRRRHRYGLCRRRNAASYEETSE